MRTPARLRGSQLAGIASAGVVVGHCLAYLLAYPPARARAAYLSSTGHGSFDRLVPIAAVGALVAAILLARRALAGGDAPPAPVTAAHLAAIQLPAFALLEAAERGFSWTAAATDPAVAVGLVLQVLLALGSALLVAPFVRAVRRIAGRRVRLPQPTRALRPSRTRPFVGRAPHLASARRRAPPLLT